MSVSAAKLAISKAQQQVRRGWSLAEQVRRRLAAEAMQSQLVLALQPSLVPVREGRPDERLESRLRVSR